MWPDGEGPSHNGPGRASSGSEVVVIGDQITSSAALQPTISNIHNSTKCHIGPKFVSISQTVHSNEVVKGRFLGLELVSPLKSRRLRCSVAVCVCWAFVVASGLGIYFLCFAFYVQESRIDIDLSCPRYLWDLVKNSTRAERVLCTIASLLVILCIFLVVYFTVIAKPSEEREPDPAPHEWNITREMWLAKPYSNADIISVFEPLRLVIVQHTVSAECHRFMQCATEMRNIQDYYINYKSRDIPYNFQIGNDGRVYEGRGWRKEGAHTAGFNRCSIGIGFIGDYREDQIGHSTITVLQQKRAQMLLEGGVKMGYLHPDYYVVAARDIQRGGTESPGSALYNALQQWTHFDFGNRFRNKTCEEINAMFKEN